MSDTLLTVKPVNSSVLQLKETSSLLLSKKQFIYQLLSTHGTVRDILSIPVQEFIIPSDMTSEEQLENCRNEARRLYQSIHKYYYLLDSRLPTNYESYTSYQADGVQDVLEFISCGQLYHYEVSQYGQEFYYFNNFDRDAVAEDVRFYLDGVNEGENHIILHPGNFMTGYDLVLSVSPISNKYMDTIYTIQPRTMKILETPQLIAGFIKLSMTVNSIYRNFQTWDFRDTKCKM